MARQVKQFRYYGNGHPKNYPSSISYRNLMTGSIFDPYKNIVQLGIQSLPGTQFYLNSASNPVIIGFTGIYELSVSGATTITDLRFEQKSLQAINDVSNAFLIVDIIYEGE